MAFNKLVFPDPEGPNITLKEPSWQIKETSFKATVVSLVLLFE